MDLSFDEQQPPTVSSCRGARDRGAPVVVVQSSNDKSALFVTQPTAAQCGAVYTRQRERSV